MTDNLPTHLWVACWRFCQALSYWLVILLLSSPSAGSGATTPRWALLASPLSWPACEAPLLSPTVLSLPPQSFSTRAVVQLRLLLCSLALYKHAYKHLRSKPLLCCASLSVRLLALFFFFFYSVTLFFLSLSFCVARATWRLLPVPVKHIVFSLISPFICSLPGP